MFLTGGKRNHSGRRLEDRIRLSWAITLECSDSRRIEGGRDPHIWEEVVWGVASGTQDKIMVSEWDVTPTSWW